MTIKDEAAQEPIEVDELAEDSLDDVAGGTGSTFVTQKTGKFTAH
jgi:hypothetical protein